MKLLLGACVSGAASGTLRAAGHDVVWAGEWEASQSDDDIIARAAADERILVTLDEDFGELAVVRRLPHAGIICLVAEQTLTRVLAPIPLRPPVTVVAPVTAAE